MTTAPTRLYVQSSDQNDNGNHRIGPKKGDEGTRRNFVVKSAGILSAPLLGLSGISPVLAEDTYATLPICVIGANGRTGTECVQACLSRSLPVRATSRGGVYRGDIGSNSLLSQMSCDVIDASSVATAVKGTRAVIFAASASKEGGTPSQVDNIGLVNVAKACLEAKVPQLVIVSSGAVTQPNSPVYKFLNLFGNIMAEKIKGEDTVRALYKDNNTNDGICTYTIVRPGGLTEEEGKGVSFLELNQGDTKSGRIARADVAALCVESIFYPNCTGGTTFECYDAETGKPLQTVGISNILKQKNDPSEFVTGYECRGKTFEEIFNGLKKDA